MRFRTIFSFARAAIVAALVIVGFFALPVSLINSTSVNAGRMSALLLSKPGLPDIKVKPASSSLIPPAASRLSVLENAYKREPSKTGYYSANWISSIGKTQDLLIFLYFLPTPDLAAQVQTQSYNEFLGTAGKKSENLTTIRHLTVPGIPTSTGQFLHAPATKVSPASQAMVVTFRYGKIAVTVFDSGPTIKPSDVNAYVHREYDLIARKEPTFAIALPYHPVGWSVGYFILGLLLVVAAGVGPWAFGVVRTRHAEQRAAAAVRHRQVRGAKVLRQQRSARRR